MSRLLFMTVLLFGCVRAPDDGDGDVNGPDPKDDDPYANGTTIDLVAFNVESGGAESGAISDQVAEITGEALWGFSEVEDEDWAQAFADAAADNDGQNFDYVLGNTGYSDRLAIVWDNERLALLDAWELDNINVGGTARAPLVGQMESRETGTRFLFVVNHLWRSEADNRHEQATRLNEWARDEDQPIVTAGDFNFDYRIDGTYNDKGYDLLTEDRVFQWVRPDTLIATQCSSSYPDSVLDFVFTAGAAKDWSASSEILFPESGYCPDDWDHPDHRPVRASIRVP